MSVADLVENYDNILKSLLESHAPVQKKVVTLRASSPWFTDEIDKLKVMKRRLERRWRANKLPVDREKYVKQCLQVNTAMFNSKCLSIQLQLTNTRITRRSFLTLSTKCFREKLKNYTQAMILLRN